VWVVVERSTEKDVGVRIGGDEEERNRNCEGRTRDVCLRGDILYSICDVRIIVMDVLAVCIEQASALGSCL
jgi:hypothetical protein